MGVRSRRVPLGALTQPFSTLPSQYLHAFGHQGVIKAGGEGACKLHHGAAPSPANGPGWAEHGSNQPVAAPMASSIPATQQLPSAPTSNSPSASLPWHSTCSATQIKLSFIRLGWPQARFVGKSGLVKKTT